MEFARDDAEHDRNQRERGFGFDLATGIFEGETIEIVDTRRDHGERRVRAIGRAGGLILTVAYTDRRDVRRIISARLDLGTSGQCEGAQAMARVTLDDLRMRRPVIDRVVVDATTEDDIARHASEDGDTVEPGDGHAVRIVPPALLRTRLSMSQAEFADAIRVPLKTVQNWEQARTRPDPAARTLLGAPCGRSGSPARSARLGGATAG